ncbi:MAG TPA: acyl carrier protein [Candidatus Limnocylindrales bacterium]|jgi:acyl carrier protein|nr:acyl carrier protein [Candidatus Limnocylindrales bacterium]
MNIEERIRTFILKNLYFAEGSALSDDVSFLAEGIIDSMGALELVTFVESEFGIRIDMSEVVVKNFDSIAKLANFVRRKLALKPQGANGSLQVPADIQGKAVAVALPTQEAGAVRKYNEGNAEVKA